MSESRVNRRYCGRDFSESEIDWINDQAKHDMTRIELSRRVCEQFHWRKADGGLKDMSARVALLRMHREGVIRLPHKTNACAANAVRLDRLRTLPATDPPAHWLEVPDSLDAVRPVGFEIVKSGPLSPVWNSFIERYHYLGFKRLPGAQMRYLIRSANGEPLALMGFGAAAWKTAPRDTFIGWDADTRQRNLPLVVNNARFLILPWVTIPNLASHILSQCEKRIAKDWIERYAIEPVLLETFCEIPRFRGICYRSANWTLVGQTKGRGKMDRFNKYALPIKDIWLKPLQKNWRKTLNA